MAPSQQHAGLFALRPAVLALVAHVLRAHRSDADVEDCASETFRRALEGADRVRDGAPVRPWLLGIAHHVALDARRTRARALARSAPHAAEEAQADPLERVRDTGPTPDERVEQSQRSEHVQRALGALPAEQRRVLLMHARGLGYREIATELSLPIGTVCTWISRARQQLARTLNDADPR
jgi:RNA polymerase sigma-70 factor (ECF subfamily)